MNRYILICLCLLTTILGGAQNNRYGVDDHLYSYYVMGEKHKYDANVDLYIDSLLVGARAIGDHKAECLGWLLKLRSVANGSESDVRIATDSIKSVSRRYGYLQYYYYACLEMATYMLDHDNLIDAVRYTSQMRVDAYSDNYPYGIYSCHCMVGDINYRRGNYMSALDEYDKSLTVIKQMPDQVPAQAYQKCGQVLYLLGRHDEALLYLDSCLAYTNLRLSSCHEAYKYKNLTLFYLHRFDDFKKSFAEMKAYENVAGRPKYSRIGELYWKIINTFVDGDTEKAKAMALELPTRMMRADLLMTFCEFTGEYDKAYLYSDTVNKETMTAYGSSNGADIVALNSALKKSELEHEAKDLQIMRDKLALQNHDLERNKEKLEIENAMLELNRMNAEMEEQNNIISNYDLEINNRAFSINQRNTVMEREKALSDEEQQTHYHRRKLIIIHVVALTLLILAMIGFIVKRTRAIRNLKENNAKLEAARQKADELRQKAEKSEQMKTLFLQNMSHDIRTPLNAICGFSQLIIDPEVSEGMDDDQRKQFADLIVNNTDMLTTLVNDILNVSELESGKYKMISQRVAVNDLCRMALKAVIHRKPADVDMTFETNVPNDFSMLTDRLRVQQVLTNFLTNAIKHTHKGEICLTCMLDEDGKNIEFAVRDTGEGVPVDKAEQIFGRFEKLDASRQATGLGLSICRLIAHHLNGEVSLDTSYAGGARFVFRHPITTV